MLIKWENEKSAGDENLMELCFFFSVVDDKNKSFARHDDSTLTIISVRMIIWLNNDVDDDMMISNDTTIKMVTNYMRNMMI